ncbi:MAG: DUF4468 domain-containing protein [Bacteroidota bacterium]
MKKFGLLFIIMILTYISSAQDDMRQLPRSQTTNKICYTDIITLDTTFKRNLLFSNASEWFAKTYKSSKDVIQLSDREGGKIVGKAAMKVYHKALGTDNFSGYVNYTISIYVKEGKFKYEITDFTHSGAPAGSYGNAEGWYTRDGKMWRKYFDYYLQQIDQNTKSLIGELKQSMMKRDVGSNNDAW